MAVIVTPPEKTVLPYGQENWVFPYYIFAEDKSNFISATIKDDTHSESSKEYMKVHAKLQSGYYWETAEMGNNYRITDQTYYDSTPPKKGDADYKECKYNGYAVDVIRVDTLKTGTFQFDITSQMQFQLEGDKNIVSPFTTTYNVEITDSLKYR